MSYSPAWTYQNGSGRVEAGSHFARQIDMTELTAAITRRRRLVYQNDLAVTIPTWVSPAPINTFRSELLSLLSPATGSLGGSPPTPSGMKWLWPEAGGDENKIIVSGSPGQGEVSLLAKITPSGNWTDPSFTSGQTAVRAVHCNELRAATEAIRRGRWDLPIYFSAGLFSILPDTTWLSQCIAHSEYGELRSAGYAILRMEGASPVKGLTNVTVRNSSNIKITADAACTVYVYHCLRHIDFDTDPPTWNQYDPSAGGNWSGGLGAGDSTLIGSLSLTAGQPGTLSGSAVQSALQNMVDGSNQNFLIRRGDTGSETIQISGSCRVEFDLDSPPS
ncbi:MAG: hypothetical protein K8S55_03165 [Phycisphaerae bacterium]|nr:hypothetical protein [Phycisphaerae bacterium]